MDFISFRRYYLDKLLSELRFYGKIVDIGGKKRNKRGSFRPPLEQCESWEYVNIDKSTGPDYLCSADKIAVANDSFDFVIMTEVIEHLETPEAVIKECVRVLKKNSLLIISAPFLYPIHADPTDLQRWTPEKIRKEWDLAGLNVERIEYMGGIIGVIFDLIAIYIDSAPQNLLTKAFRKILFLSTPFFLYLDSKSKAKDRITTGFYIEARKA